MKFNRNSPNRREHNQKKWILTTVQRINMNDEVIRQRKKTRGKHQIRWNHFVRGMLWFVKHLVQMVPIEWFSRFTWWNWEVTKSPNKWTDNFRYETNILPISKCVESAIQTFIYCRKTTGNKQFLLNSMNDVCVSAFEKSSIDLLRWWIFCFFFFCKKNISSCT